MTTPVRHISQDELEREGYGTDAAIRFALNTVGPGLPTFLGRAAGDHHFNETDEIDYVLRGTFGGRVYDDFTDREIGSLVSGTQTQIGGKTFDFRQAGNSYAADPTIVAPSKVRMDGATQFKSLSIVNAHSAGGAVTIKTVQTGQSSSGGGIFCAGVVGSDIGSNVSGYWFEAEGTHQVQQVRLSRNGTQVGIADIGNQANAEYAGGTHSMEMQVTATGDVTCLWDGNPLITYHDDAPLQGRAAGARPNFYAGRNDYDYIEVLDVGTLLWVPASRPIVVLTQAAYDALTPDPSTLYVIQG